MPDCCDKNPLQRSGINQSQRLLAGLKQGYILVDEREYEDWIFFADKFSAYLKYYNTGGAVAGDWKPFFSNDISAILGSIAVQEAEVYRRSVKERFDFIRDDDNAGNIVAIKQKLNELFAAIFSISRALDDYLLKLPDKDNSGEKDFGFKGTLINLVQTKLSPALRRLVAYYLAVDGVPAASTDFLENSDMSGWKVLNRQVVNADTIINGEGLSNNWWSNGAVSWNAHITAINADESIFGPAAWMPDEYRRISHAVNHNLFSSIFDQYLQVYSRIVQEAEKALLSTLEKWDAHPAHYTLFLSFLKLFRFAQADINTTTQKHLDFYYKEVLRLKPKGAEPNHAHILVELSKQTYAYALKKGTEYKAGKDSDGKEVIYAQDTEETFNKAKVALLKSVYKGDNNGKDDQLTEVTNAIEVNNKGRLFSSPVTNSNDGLGAELKSANKEWHPYVNKKFKEGRLIDIDMPNAQIGFAVASHYLYLKEGERRVYIRLVTGNNAVLATGLSCEAWITTGKGWFKIPSLTITEDTLYDEEGCFSCAMISFLLHGDVPAVTNYDQAIHGGTFTASVPMLKIYLINEDNTSKYKYDELKEINITKVGVEVKVGLNDDDSMAAGGLKQLLLSNGVGNLDAAKPFLPFGPAPLKGASFIIGNEELFKKKNASFRLQWEWLNLTDPYYYIDFEDPNTWAAEGTLYPEVSAKYLGAGMWKSLISGTKAIFNSSATIIHFPDTLQPLTVNNNEAIRDYIDEYKLYDVTSVNGFLKLELNDDFRHEWYQKTLTKYLIDQAKPSPTGKPTEPHEPYTPKIQGISLHYKASTSSTFSNESEFDNRSVQFFHIYPFGEAEQHGYLLNAAEVFLLPQFTHTEISARVDHIAEFYIGIEKLKQQQSVNILFQLMEGSSNPLLVKPDDHIRWSYLSNNQWKDFNDQQVGDATRQLVQSGIISFIIPEGATTDNTILPPNYIWLRAAVSEAAEAVCKLISVDAQAAVVTFQPKDNAENFLDTALPAGTISKLKAPSSSIKKIVQPYSSFGGRAKEANKNFYVRVSERLRHKDRAITIWDYEHLVLEAFPQLHKVKCLNHTKFEKNKDTGEIEYNEVAPGYVTVITIPDLTNRNDTNPLRPYTNQNILLEVEEYLKKRISCHVKLRVKNPRFEEIWLSFELKLLKGFDDFSFYSKQLSEEITQYLTPWAFSNGADIQFGGKIRKSTLIDFIEERPYVDFITNVKMYHDTNPDHEDAGDCDEKINQAPGIAGNLEVVEASTARSILVSTPSSKHVITEIKSSDIGDKSECADLAKPVIT